MPRPKAFNPDTALDSAVHIFWAKGFDNTSMQDLVLAMGINRGSLYDTFGDKHALYLKALDRYVEKFLPTNNLNASNPALVRDILGKAFDHIIDGCCDAGHDHGCMVTNSICELCDQDSEISGKLKRLMGAYEDMLCGLIERAQSAGEVDHTRDARAMACFFLSSMQGMLVLRKLSYDKSRLRQAADQALLALF